MGKKKAAEFFAKLTEAERDLLWHIEHDYQLETDSLGVEPLLRGLKDGEVIRPVSANRNTVKALEDRGLIGPVKSHDPLTIAGSLTRNAKNRHLDMCGCRSFLSGGAITTMPVPDIVPDSFCSYGGRLPTAVDPEIITAGSHHTLARVVGAGLSLALSDDSRPDLLLRRYGRGVSDGRIIIRRKGKSSASSCIQGPPCDLGNHNRPMLLRLASLGLVLETLPA